MKVLIEGYYYDPATLCREHIPDWLPEYHRDKDGKVCYNYVGHVYAPEIKDYIFFLPKVILTEQVADDESKDLVFGKEPSSIISIDDDNPQLDIEDRRFISDFAVWVYRALMVFRDDHPESNIIREHNIASVGQHSDARIANTLLDVILELINFNHENRNFVMFTLKNLHSGANKINWTKTISRSQAVVQDGAPIYLDPVNKKRQVNFDEELFVIYYSILHYVRQHYGFDAEENLNFALITDEMFENYLDGMGCARLMRIKYKYFSDKALRLWNLCYAFFGMAHPVDVHENQKEYLLAQNFNVVFEAIIDKLVGSNELPDQLKEQKDGKRVDHMFTYDGLMYPDARQQELSQQIYYIGDSKYYKTNANVGENSVYKQFTYARNVIQWNIDLWNSGNKEKQEKENEKGIWLRDEVTEGYNIIPNFFISATIDKERDYDCDRLEDKNSNFQNWQFPNRLFDRDTMLITHYNVNFLYVLSLYGRDDESAQSSWKESVRKKFRERVQKTLSEKYQFYAMTAKPNVDAEQYMHEHFRELIGKVFTPFEDKEYFSLALDNAEEYQEKNDELVAMLRQDFQCEKCAIGVDPSTVVSKAQHLAKPVVPKRFLTQHWLENYADANILMGYCKSQEQLDWILGNNDKGTLIYNVRLDKGREGHMIRQRLIETKVTFVVLYNGDLMTEGYRVFRVHHHAEMSEARMKQALYPNPQGKYFCYVFDEEVSLGNLDIDKALHDKQETGYPEFAPFMLTGEELLSYRK